MIQHNSWCSWCFTCWKLLPRLRWRICNAWRKWIHRMSQGNACCGKPRRNWAEGSWRLDGGPSELRMIIWLVVWNIFLIFPYGGNKVNNWLSYFTEGLKPPTSHGYLMTIRYRSLSVSNTVLGDQRWPKWEVSPAWNRDDLGVFNFVRRRHALKQFAVSWLAILFLVVVINTYWHFFTE